MLRLFSGHTLCLYESSRKDVGFTAECLSVVKETIETETELSLELLSKLGELCQSVNQLLLTEQHSDLLNTIFRLV